VHTPCAAQISADIQAQYAAAGQTLSTCDASGKVITAQPFTGNQIPASALAIDPGESAAHYRLGRVYQAMGKSAEAQKEFAEVRQNREKSQEDLVRKMSSSPPALTQKE